MERVLPTKDIKKRLPTFAIGLAADCDRPESDIEKIMRTNLPNASTLPFAGFVTHDGKWVEGFSGFKNAGDFKKIMEKAEATPHLQATKAVRKKLAKLAATAGQAAKRDNWKAVLKAGQAADKTVGRCPERNAIADLVQKARAWAAQQFEQAVKTAKSGGDLTAATKALSNLRRNFAGQPEADDASKGIEALRRLAKIVDAEAGDTPPPASAREKAAARFKDTRWAAIFARPS